MKHKNSPVTMAIFCAVAPKYQIIDDEGWLGELIVDYKHMDRGMLRTEEFRQMG